MLAREALGRLRVCLLEDAAARARGSALGPPSMAALDRELDDRWRTDRDYIIADLNGSAMFPARRAEDAS